MAELESLFPDCFSRGEGQRLTQSHYPSLESRQLDLEMSYLSPLDKTLDSFKMPDLSKIGICREKRHLPAGFYDFAAELCKTSLELKCPIGACYILQLFTLTDR